MLGRRSAHHRRTCARPIGVGSALQETSRAGNLVKRAQQRHITWLGRGTRGQPDPRLCQVSDRRAGVGCSPPFAPPGDLLRARRRPSPPGAIEPSSRGLRVTRRGLVMDPGQDFEGR